MIPEWFGYESVAQDWRKCSAFQITGRLGGRNKEGAKGMKYS